MPLPAQTTDLAALVAAAAHERGGTDPVLVDVRSRMDLADAFVAFNRQTSKALLFGAGMSVLALSFVLVMAFLVEVAL